MDTEQIIVDEQFEGVVEDEQVNMHAPKLKTLHVVGVIIAAILVIAAIALAGKLIEANGKSENVHNRYNECVSAASQLMVASDYLTTQCRTFVLTGDRTFMDGYFEELLSTQRRDKAVALLGAESGDEGAAAELLSALAESNELALTELYAMKLTCEAVGIGDMPETLNFVDISAEDEALSANAKRQRAEEMVLGEDYQNMKSLISGDVDECAAELVKGLESRVFEIERLTDRLLLLLLVITFLLMALVLFTAVSNYALVTRPMMIHEKELLDNHFLSITGCYEIRHVANAYNVLLRKLQKQTVQLRHDAETDALTGLLNRGLYDKLLATQEGDFALILIDVDRFKQVNDKYGHEVGDEVLKRVAEIIASRFRSSDYVCRIGGDEFAIIVPNASVSSKDALSKKLESISDEVAKDVEGMPHVTVSAGVAFRNKDTADSNMYSEGQP